MLRTATTYGDRLMILIGMAALPMSRRDKESFSTLNPTLISLYLQAAACPWRNRSERISLDVIEDVFH